MLELKKINFSKRELISITENLEGYIWLAIDIKRGIIAAGDEYVVALKHALFAQKSSIFNIFGVGLDLTSGEIDYVSPINIKYIDKNSTKYVPYEKRDRIENLIRYFFSELPIYKQEKRQRYSRFQGLASLR